MKNHKLEHAIEITNTLKINFIHILHFSPSKK